MKKFTKEGKEVLVVKTIEGGFLAKEVYGYFDEEYEEEAETISETISETITFYEELFDVAPTEKYATAVVELKKQAETVTNEISELKRMRENEKSLIQKVSKFPVVQQLVDYITGDFEFVLYLKTLEQKSKRGFYSSSYIAMAHTKGDGYCLYKLRNDNYFSPQDDTQLLVFKTQKEMDDYSKTELIKRLTKYEVNYNKSSNLKDFLNNIDRSCKAKEDEEVLLAYGNKMKLFLDQERIEKEAKLKKELEDYDKKKKELELLSQSI